MVKPAPTNLTPAVSTTVIDSVQIEQADVLTRYWAWQAPTVIISDGAYGLGLVVIENLLQRIRAFWGKGFVTQRCFPNGFYGYGLSGHYLL